MKSILCPVDFSTTSDHAVATAAKIAQKCSAQLDLFNVHLMRDMSPSELLLGSGMKVAATTNQLEELSSEITRVYKISCYGQVRSSSRPLSQIISELGQHYDLIVMGTNGADIVYDSFFGTNSYLVAKESYVPVLILPPSYDYSGFSTMVFAMDYFHELTAPPEQLIQWADWLDSQITVLQIMTEEFRHRHDEELNRAQLNIKQFLGDRHHNFKTIYSDRPEEGIVDFISVNGCDVLALCFRHHSFIQRLFHTNVVKNLCAHVPCPLFLFHF